MEENSNNPQEEKNFPEYKPDNNDGINPVINPILAGVIGLFGGFILYQFVGGTLLLLVFGFNLKSAPPDLYRLMTAASQILFILLPALLFSKWFYIDVGKIIRIRIPSWQEIGLFVVGIVILTSLLQNFLYIQNYLLDSLAKSSPLVHTVKSALDSFDKLVQDTYVDLLKPNNFADMLLIIIVVSVVPAFCEESLFRGFIQRSFEMKMKPFWAALITAIFFGLYHVNPYSLIPLICLGLFFGFAAYSSETIILPIILHFLNNFAAVILYFTFGNDELINNPTVSKLNLVPTIEAFIGLSILFFILIFFIKKYYSKLKKA